MGKTTVQIALETKSIKISIDAYNWLRKQPQIYGDTMAIIFDRILAEVKECRENNKDSNSKKVKKSNGMTN